MKFLQSFTILLITFLIIGNTYKIQAQGDPCDVNLIQVAIVDVTGLLNQPDFNSAHNTINRAILNSLTILNVH